MRKNIGAHNFLEPMPVLIIATYNPDGSANAMNAAWGMISDFSEVSISMSEHQTTDNLAQRKAFTVSLGTEDTVTACDYVGIVSGRKEKDKFAKSGFTAIKSEYVDAPLIEQLPLTLECKVKSFDDGILVGEIVNVSVDEKIYTDGKIDMKKLKPICYDPINGGYYSIGERVADAFSEGKKLK